MSSEVTVYLLLSWFLGYLTAIAVRRRRHSYYKHKKGGVYRLIGHGLHTERNEELVAYESVTDGRLWFRPIEMWYDERFTEVPRP